jgi:hypothetical protein
MHPIERLRWIARAEDEPAATLASEAAWTLGELAEDEPTALLTACRRLLDRHPACGPLWWVSATLTTADDPVAAARRAAAELCSDPTPDRLAKALRASFTADDVVALTVPVELSLACLAASKPHPIRVLGTPWSLRRAMRALSEVASEVTGWSSGEEREALAGAAVLIVEALAAGPRAVLVDPGVAAVIRASLDGSVPTWIAIGAGRALPSRLFDAASERAGDAVDEVALDSFALAIAADVTGDPAAVAAQVSCPAGPELLHRPF